MEKPTYINAIKKIVPKQYHFEELAGHMYRRNGNNSELNLAGQTALRLAQKMNIRQRATVINPEKLPAIELANENERPEKWGKELIEELAQYASKETIGHMSLSYNIAASRDTLPNLGSQMAQLAGIHPDWIDHNFSYGCAAGVLSTDDAINYCSRHERASIAITLDQCLSALVLPPITDPDFKRSMVSNLLFADGAVGMLILPPELADNWNGPLIKIIGLHKIFIPGSLIYMREGKFLMNDLRAVIPRLVANKLINPLLHEYHLKMEEIEEWSIHQGGPEILKQFMDKDILGLSPEQISRSMDLFYEYGNLSAASCLFVLESFFNESDFEAKKGKKGMVVGFGAGYYLAAFLYEWV